MTQSGIPADLSREDSRATASAVGIVLETSLGGIELIVYPIKAPLSAGAFLSFVDDGTFARRGTFYRLVRRQDNDRSHPAIDIVQGGLRDSPLGAVAIPHETTEQTGLKHLDGSVSLARGRVGTATGGTFFISIGDQPALDAGGARNPDGQGFAVFGRVTRGMEIVRAIHRLPASDCEGGDHQRGQILELPVRILKAVRK